MTSRAEQKDKRERARIKGNPADYQLVSIVYHDKPFKSDLSNLPINNVVTVFNPKIGAVLYIGKGELKKYFNMTISGVQYSQEQDNQRQRDIAALKKSLEK